MMNMLHCARWWKQYTECMQTHATPKQPEPKACDAMKKIVQTCLVVKVKNAWTTP